MEYITEPLQLENLSQAIGVKINVAGIANNKT
jgi:hypothetical protein